MPAGAAVGAIGGAAGGFFNSRSAKKSSRAQAQTMRDAAMMMSSGNVLNRAQAYNPYIFNALMNPNKATTNPFQQQMNNLAGNPGYIDPALMNLPLTQAMRGQQQGMMAAQGQLGRSGMEGGIGDAYALASQAALTGQRAGIMQNYSLWREQQRRSDMDWLMNQYSGALGQAQQGQGAQAGMWGDVAQYQTPHSITGGMITGALAGMGGMMGMGNLGMGGGGQQAMTATPATQNRIGSQLFTQPGQAGYNAQNAFGGGQPMAQQWGQNLFTQRRP